MPTYLVTREMYDEDNERIQMVQARSVSLMAEERI